MSDIRANTISDAAGTGPVELTKQSAAKSWVCLHMNFYLEESFNISSATDLGTAVATVALTNSMTVSTHRCGVAMSLIGGAAGSSSKGDAGTCTESVFGFSSYDGSSIASENVRVGVAIHGDLA